MRPNVGQLGPSNFWTLRVDLIETFINLGGVMRAPLFCTFLQFGFLPAQCFDLATDPKEEYFLPDKRCQVCNVPEVLRSHVAVVQ